MSYGLLSGKVAVVTGAAESVKAGIGAKIALALAAEGARVMVVDVNDGASTVSSIERAGGEAAFQRCDIGDPAQVDALVEATKARFGRLDILVNNASVGSNTPLVKMVDIPIEQWDEYYRVNVRGTFLATRAAARLMSVNGYGKVVSVGSTMWKDGSQPRLHYVSTKGAIEAMGPAMARELGPEGIRVNTVALGFVTAPSNIDRVAIRDKKKAARSIHEDLDAADLIGTIVYLCSPLSDAVTGQCIIVDKGEIFG